MDPHLHLLEISRTVTPGANAVLVLDGAGWAALTCVNAGWIFLICAGIKFPRSVW